MLVLSGVWIQYKFDVLICLVSEPLAFGSVIVVNTARPTCLIQVPMQPLNSLHWSQKRINSVINKNTALRYNVLLHANMEGFFVNIDSLLCVLESRR